MLQGGVNTNYIADAATLSVVNGSVVNLNFSGSPEVVGFLEVNGVSQPGGLYGSAASGAPNQLPQFSGSGTLLVVNPQAFSRKAQGAGMFDISLPLGGTGAVECRSGGANGNYQLVVTFSRPVVLSNATVTSGTGAVQSTSGNNSPVLTINLTGVTNAQRISVSLNGINYGGNTGNLAVPVAFLVGDTSGNGTVNATDLSQTKAQSGHPVSSANFREDVTASGAINGSDVSTVKLSSGTGLP
jgi:hypothetical protein